MAFLKLFDSLLEELDKDSDIVFFLDLDSTIYDLSDRQMQIFKEFAAINEHMQTFPAESHALKNLSYEHMSFYPEDSIRNFGHSQIDAKFGDVFYPFWSQRFFSNEFCRYDKVENGAKEFVQKVYEKGGHIHYLTGRDTERMEEGTLYTLKRDGLFPNGEECEQVKLIMKPEQNLDDAQFKHDYIVATLNDYHKGILVDNEPGNLDILKDKMDKLHLVHYDSYHSGAKEVPDCALVLESFEHWYKS
ncbi:MAG: hypothetical protein VX642_11035 [Bdellovibrionota bacterium]|nr:hypothetical protein [Bdellovibrionota bacterium]